MTEKLEHGEINWTKKTILATGSGKPDLKQPNVAAVRLKAEHAAQASAYKNIIETLKRVRIMGSTLGEGALEDSMIRTQVEGVVEGCKTVDTRYYSDGGVDVTVRCALDGALCSVLAPVKNPKAMEPKGDKKYTSLIVDAVGLKLVPALSPRILDDSGAELYSREWVQPPIFRQSGAAVYVRTVEAAKKDPRAGATPLVVKAAALGAARSDVRLSKTDGDKLQSENLYFLSEGRVIFAIDGP